MQFPEHEPLPLSESVPSQGEPAISIAENHVHAGEEEDQVGSALVEYPGKIFPQEIEVLKITAMIRQRDIKIAGWFSHRKIPAAMHRETKDGIIILKAEGIGVALMHVEIDDEGPSDFLFSLKNPNGDPDVVENAKTLPVIRACMMRSARQIGADAIFASVPGGQYGSRDSQTGSSREGWRPRKAEPTFFSNAQSAQAQFVEIRTVVRQFEIRPIDFVGRHQIVTRDDSFVDEDLPQRGKFPHRKRMTLRKRNLVVFMIGRSHTSPPPQSESAQTTNQRVGECLGAEGATEITGVIPFADCRVVSGLDAIGGHLEGRITTSNAHMVQHHDATHGDGQWIGHALASDVGG